MQRLYLFGKEPAKVAWHLLGVAEHSSRAEGAQQAHHGGRCADSVPVGSDVGSYGDALEGLQELSHLGCGVILRSGPHLILPPSRCSRSWSHALPPGQARSAAWASA